MNLVTLTWGYYCIVNIGLSFFYVVEMFNTDVQFMSPPSMGNYYYIYDIYFHDISLVIDIQFVFFTRLSTKAMLQVLMTRE